MIFRLGRLRQGGAKVGLCIAWMIEILLFQGPGIFFVIPCIDHFKCVDLRTVSFDVPPQEVKDLTNCKGLEVAGVKPFKILAT